MPLGQLPSLWGLGSDGHVVPLLSRLEVDIYFQKAYNYRDSESMAYLSSVQESDKAHVVTWAIEV